MHIKYLLRKINKYRDSQDIDISEFNSIITTNKNFVVIDVRSPLEFSEGHLNRAVNIPLYKLERYCNSKIKDKNKTIILYCQSGIRSKRAISVLKKHGFKNLYNLKGGLDAI